MRELTIYCWKILNSWKIWKTLEMLKWGNELALRDKDLLKAAVPGTCAPNNTVTSKNCSVSWGESFNFLFSLKCYSPLSKEYDTEK